jgi:molybdopterin-biosynthesis enzyme MoeA-like protein
LLKGGKPVETRSVTADLPESIIADGLAEIQSRYDNVAIGSYPKYKDGKFATCLVLRSIDDDALKQSVSDVVTLIKSLGEQNPVLG